MRRTLSTIAILGIAVTLASMVPGAAHAEQFSESIDVVTVEVPVQVVVDGEPVRGLTKDDFEIYDGRKRQTITGFEAVDLEEYGAGELPLADIPISGRRHFLLMFDMAFSDPSAISRARETAKGLVREKMHESDLVAVATYSDQLGPQLVIGFTSDRRQVDLAIETLGLPKLVERAPDPLGFVIADARDITTGLERAQPEAGAGRGKFDAAGAFAEQLQDISIGTARAARGEAQGRVLAMTTAFEDLAKVLNDVQGRKYVVLLSEGFDAEVILGTSDVRRSGELAEASARGQYDKIDSEERYGSTGAMTAVESMLEEFRRADATIQAVDIGGLRAGSEAKGRAGGQDSLFMMADGTGGELFRNYNELSGAMSEMLDRTSVTYLLSFQAENLELDGSYHKLKVKLDGGPRGARLVHRPGFYAPRPFGEMSPLERRLAAAEQIMAGRDLGAFESSVLAAPFPGEGGRAYVPVLIEIDGPGILAGNHEGTAKIEIYAYAVAEDGTVGGYMTQTMGLDIGKIEPVLRQSGIKFFGDLDLAPGDYLLRVMVRDGNTGRSSVRNVPIDVPDFGTGAPTLAMPLFPEEPGKWLVVQEAEGSEERKSRPYPFVMNEQPYMPAARPVVTGATPARFVLLGYNLGDGQVPLDAHLVTEAGERVSGSKISFVEQLARTTTQAQLVLELDASAVAPGRYRLVATLNGVEGKGATASIPIVIPSS